MNQNRNKHGSYRSVIKKLSRGLWSLTCLGQVFVLLQFKVFSTILELSDNYHVRQPEDEKTEIPLNLYQE